MVKYVIKKLKYKYILGEIFLIYVNIWKKCNRGRYLYFYIFIYMYKWIYIERKIKLWELSSLLKREKVCGYVIYR